MTVYVVDSGPLIDLFSHYYPSRFPSLWQQFDLTVSEGRITSTREVFNELQGRDDALSTWCKGNRGVFVTPTPDELTFVRRIFDVSHFQAMIRIKERQLGRPVADPFIIARAASLDQACVVTTEQGRPNAPRIPNVCEHFGIDCTNLEGFMEREGWTF